jgi:hypothetical protein
VGAVEMIYQWRPGSRIKISAQDAGERLEYLNKQNGKLTADIVVEDAKPEESVLHPAFEWDDLKAAHQYRLEQGRHLIRSVTIIHDTPEEEPKPIRAFVVVAETPKSDVYVPTMDAMLDENLRKQVLARALAELLAIKRKYEDLAELADVFAAIDRVNDEIVKTV